MSSPAQLQFQVALIQDVEKLPFSCVKLIYEQYFEYFNSVFKHFKASRNDLFWVSWSEPHFLVYCFWAARWWELCPKYFKDNYPDAQYWHDGFFMWEKIPQGKSSTFPDGDTTSSLAHLPLRQRYDHTVPVGFGSFEVQLIDSLSEGLYHKPVYLQYV